jgi:metal-responsive CopG/Arc/MetJ family transcriptional regulator
MRQKKLFDRKRDRKGRPREMEEPRTISIQFENAMLEELDEKVWRMGKSRSDFIRELVGKALKKGEG